MNFNTHSNLKGMHAFLSASNYHWIRYDEDKLVDTYNSHLAKMRGTELHEFAEKCIKLQQKLPKSNKTLNSYVNDAIGLHMDTEVLLFYSINCFGTADAISFKNNKLRIHDLKTGTTPAHIEQLLIYVALFCLEYNYKPYELDIELRIYQNDEILVHEPTAEEIVPIMDKIITFDKILTKRQEEEV